MTTRGTILGLIPFLHTSLSQQSMSQITLNLQNIVFQIFIFEVLPFLSMSIINLVFLYAGTAIQGYFSEW